MEIPSKKQAEEILKEAECMNPGPWAAHSRATAENAQCIAGKCGGMDADAAYIMGLLHDIGRREGVTEIMHIFDGYRYLEQQGFTDAAAICLTHSFPKKDARMFFGKFDCTDDDIYFLQDYFNVREYNDYDKLIQLCDGISLPQGAVLMEKRFVDVAMRHGLHDFTLEKWRAWFNLKQYFDDKAGCDIYTLLPNIVENTFGF